MKNLKRQSLELGSWKRWKVKLKWQRLKETIGRRKKNKEKKKGIGNDINDEMQLEFWQILLQNFLYYIYHEKYYVYNVFTILL